MRRLTWRSFAWPGALLAAAGIGAAIAASPGYLLDDASDRAAACLARFRTELPSERASCEAVADDFELPGHFFWTKEAAAMRQEEHGARLALAKYWDAVVGTPDAAARSARAELVAAAEQRMEEGSDRLVLDELGPAVGAPRLGNVAMSAGDRTTLLEHYDSWGLWYVRFAALEAAHLAGDRDAAQTMSRRYAEFDPRDSQLRAAIGSTLCLSERPEAGLELLDRIPQDRAGSRHANVARHYGEVWAVIVACARKADTKVPGTPAGSGAGHRDAEETRAIQRALLAQGDEERERALDQLSMMLSSLPPPQGPGLDPRYPSARALLAGAYAMLDDEASAEAIAALLEPRSQGEIAAPAKRVWTTIDFMASATDLVHPSFPPEAAERAAKRLGELATEDLPPEQADPLARASAELWLVAMRERALSGDAERAGEAASAGLRALEAGDVAVGLGQATAYAVAGSADRALATIEAAMSSEIDDPDLRLGLAVQEVEILASLGRADEAAQKAAAMRATVTRTSPQDLASSARWLALALGQGPQAEASASPVALPWVGFADREARWHRDAQAPVFDALESGIAGALAGDARTHLSLRYALLERRGDAPLHLAAYFLVGSRALGIETGSEARSQRGAIETWLDALGAIDSRRVPLRAYASARAQAARMRGDAQAADVWHERQTDLGAIAAEELSFWAARYLRY